METERIVVVSRHGRFDAVWCARCGERVEAWAPVEIESLVRLGGEAIARLIADGTLHEIASDAAEVRLCGKSFHAFLTRPHSTDGKPGEDSRQRGGSCPD